MSARSSYDEAKDALATAKAEVAKLRAAMHAAESHEDDAKREYDAKDSPTLLDRVQKATLARERAGRLLATAEAKSHDAERSVDEARRQIQRDRYDALVLEGQRTRGGLTAVAKSLAKLDARAFEHITGAIDLTADYETVVDEARAIASELGIDTLSHDLPTWGPEEARRAAVRFLAEQRAADSRPSVARWLEDE